jgi:hypothetical protein
MSKLKTVLKIKLNIKYNCKDSNKSFVIVRSGRANNSYLPVTFESYNKAPDLYFNKEKHKSHLLECLVCQSKWNVVTKQLWLQDKEAGTKALKEAAR